MQSRMLPQEREACHPMREHARPTAGMPALEVWHAQQSGSQVNNERKSGSVRTVATHGPCWLLNSG